LPLNDLEAFYNNPSVAAAAAGGQSSESERMNYVLAMPAPCQRQHQFLVIYVHTAPAHHARRQAVRSTWGNVSRWSKLSAPGAITLRFIYLLTYHAVYTFIRCNSEQQQVWENHVSLHEGMTVQRRFIPILNVQVVTVKSELTVSGRLFQL